MAVAAYIEKLQADAAPPTVKQHLAAIRKLFDWLVVHLIQANPAMSVQGPKHSVIEGSTPALAVEQARALMESISTGSVAGLRDRAILGVLIYTAARVGAVSQLKVKHFRRDGHHWSSRNWSFSATKCSTSGRKSMAFRRRRDGTTTNRFSRWPPAPVSCRRGREGTQ